jgi:tripartite-type tricarboxylate transporter receptor subunit TctC
MKLPHRRQFLHLAAGGAALPALSRAARAQTYPTRPVRIIVGIGPAGASDITARVIGQWLSERLGQAFIVENRPGAGGNIGAEVVVRAPPDGYTLLLASSSDAISATLSEKLNFDLSGDMAPVAAIIRVPLILEANPSFPAKTVPELIAYAKANPGKVNMASAGTGNITHVTGELFKMMAGVNIVHVPYRSASSAIIDLLSGQVQIYFGSPPSSIQYIRAGTLRPLAVTTATRSEALPDIPTVGDFVPGFEASPWQGLCAPKNTPADIIDKLNKEINVALIDPKMKARLADLGAEVLTGSPADFGKLIADDIERWSKVIRAAHIKTE